MEHLQDFSDDGHKGYCIHCGAILKNVDSNLDHIPSKSLLNTPLPPNTPKIRVCAECNSSFSPDEEYLSAFLGAVLSGSADPDAQKIGQAAKILKGNSKLRREVENSNTVISDPDTGDRLLWYPNMTRVENCILKNARGHVFYELGRLTQGNPIQIYITPMEFIKNDSIHLMPISQPTLAGWSEVGSRMMQREISGADLIDGWVQVQEGVYRYIVTEDDFISAKIIIREYLFANVVWEND